MEYAGNPRQQFALSMNLRASVRVRLGLARQLFCAVGKDAGLDSNFKTAQAVIIAHDGAIIALNAICDQLGCLPHKSRVALPDYLECLNKLTRPQLTAEQIDFFLQLQKARVDLQNRAVFPDPQQWSNAEQLTLNHLARICQQYLRVNLAEIEQPPALTRAYSAVAPGVGLNHPSTPSQPGSQPASAAVTPDKGAGEPGRGDVQARRHLRYDCDGAAEVSSPRLGRVVRGKLHNLSAGGCFVETDWPFEVGALVEILLQVNRSSFRALGEVRMVDPFGGMGIEFRGMSAGGRERLRALISDLHAESGLEAQQDTAAVEKPQG